MIGETRLGGETAWDIGVVVDIGVTCTDPPLPPSGEVSRECVELTCPLHSVELRPFCIELDSWFLPEVADGD